MSSAGQDAIDFAAAIGLFLDPWQQYALSALLQERADGKWQTRTGLVILPRQNGKGCVDEAWELAQLFLNDAEIVLHTAHHAKTAKSAFDKMRLRIEGSQQLRSRLAADRSGGIRVANGEWGFTFKTGQRLIYGTRTSGAGRGLTIHAAVLDEAQELSDDELDALKPTMVTAPNPQTLWTGSAPKLEQEVLRRMMVRGRAGDPSLCYIEYSVPGRWDEIDLDDRSLWALANPGYGIRLDDDAILDERGTMSAEGFARERLGVFDLSSASSSLFPEGAWDKLRDSSSTITGPVTFAVEVAGDRSWSCIGAAGKGRVGTHVESVDYRPGTGWIVARCQELARSHANAGFVVRPASPAGSLIGDLENAHLTVLKASGQDYAQACGDIHDAVVDGELRHLGQGELDVSVRGAKKKSSGDAFVWDLRKSGLDIAPWTAVTLAHWGHVTRPPMVPTVW